MRVIDHLSKWAGHVVLRTTMLPFPRVLGRGIRLLALRNGAEPFSVTTSDGIRLDGLRIRASSPVPGKLPVVICHGWVECKEFHLHRARQLANAGHDVMLYDHRAHGRSRGRVVTFSVREREDAVAVLDDLQQRGWLHDRVILVGHSMGASTAIHTACVDDRVAGVVAFAPFSDFAKAILSFRDKLKLPLKDKWIIRGFEEACRQCGFDIQDTCTVTAVADLETPVLIIEAELDTNLPPELHSRPILAAKQLGEAHVFEVKGANHLNISHKNWPGVEERVVEFCKEVSEAAAEPVTA